jgi:hypothetical protein
LRADAEAVGIDEARGRVDAAAQQAADVIGAEGRSG